MKNRRIFQFCQHRSMLRGLSLLWVTPPVTAQDRADSGGAGANADAGDSSPPTAELRWPEVIGNAITYQAQIKQSGVLIDGLSDLQFSLWNALSGPSQVGSTVTQLNQNVDEGIFSADLNFGASAFDGNDRWLQVSIRFPAGSGSYQTLTPRQKINAAPYALWSLAGGSGGLTLPFSGSASSGSMLLTVQNSGTGGGLAGSGGVGIAGTSTSASGYGVIGVKLSSGGASIYGAGLADVGVIGETNNGSGVGVKGIHVASGNFGTLGTNQHGVYGQGAQYGIGGLGNSAGVIGFGTTYGVKGNVNSDVGIAGVYGLGGSQASVLGESDGIAVGVKGVWGNKYGILGTSNYAGEFVTSGSGATALFASSPNGKAIWGVNAVSGHAGYFQGFTYFSNNMGLGVEIPGFPIHHSSGARLTAGGVWTNACDRNLKANFEAVDSAAVLEKVAALPISRWNYSAESDEVKHIGPTAQDFHAAFGTGSDDTSIGTVDADGVALASIQALHQQLTETEARLVAQQAVIDALIKRVTALEQHQITADHSDIVKHNGGQP